MARKTVRFAARETMQRFGYDPLEELIKLSQGDGVQAADPATRREIALALAPYLYPKLSQVELQGEIDQTNHTPDASELMRRILSNPELADAAQKLSLEAADILVESGRVN